MDKIMQDYLTGEWVFYASARSKRPSHFNTESDVFNDTKKNCPFCVQNGYLRDEYVYVSEDKTISILKNKYPINSYEHAENFGFHDVLIDTPNHDERLGFFSQSHVKSLFITLRNRVKTLSEDEKIKYVQIFKNQGKLAGASIYHSHFQIVATPQILHKQKIIAENFKNYFEKNNSCYLCDEIKNLNDLNTLKIFENDFFVAYAPEVSPFAYGINIAPKFHISDFRNFDDSHLQSLGDILQTILKGYYKKFEVFDYNLCFQSAPFESESGAKYSYNHFFLQIVPRKSSMAGFELSTGSYINSVDPFEFAEEFRRTYL